MKKPFLFALVAIAMCACSDNMMLNEPLENPVLSRSNDQTPTVSYSVTPDMVCKYLNIARKGKTIDSITPVIEDGDTLAYVAQYTGNNGWDLISGDKRVAPVLASASSGILNLNDTINPAVQALNGMVQIVLDTKNSMDSIKDKMWEFLEPKAIAKSNRPQQRGNGTGKWIAVDTVCDSYSIQSNRLISTLWGQGSGYNSFTPMVNGVRADVGCVPVAVGQVIAQYRKNNHRNIEIPAYAYSVGSSLVFENFSTGNWLLITDTINNPNVSSLADDAFLAYLSLDMNLTYGEGSTTGSENDVMTALTNYKLTYNTSNSYSYSTVYTNLLNSKPVIVFSKVKNRENSHAFIIDGYQRTLTKYYIQYMWDPNYELEDWESPYGEPAETDKDGYAWREEIIDESETVSFAMNWGLNSISYNNIYYLAYNYRHGEYEIYYTPSWTAGGQTMNNVTKMFYNISEAVD